MPGKNIRRFANFLEYLTITGKIKKFVKILIDGKQWKCLGRFDKISLNYYAINLDFCLKIHYHL